MRSAATSTALVPERSADLLDQRRLSSGGDGRRKRRDLSPALPRLSARGRDPADRLRARHRSLRRSAQCLDLRRLYPRRALQFDPSQRSDIGMASVAVRPKCSPIFSIPNWIAGRIIVDPTRFVADPEKAKRFPELPYVTVRLGYDRVRHFNADLGLANRSAGAPAFYRRVFLQQPLGEPRLIPGSDQAGGIDGGALSGDRAKRCSQRLSLYAFERISNGGCCSNATRHALHASMPVPRSSVTRSSASDPDELDTDVQSPRQAEDRRSSA